MTVKELKERLAKYPDYLPIRLLANPEIQLDAFHISNVYDNGISFPHETKPTVVWFDLE